MAWIESHQNLRGHPKVIDLCSMMGWEQDLTIGKLHLFWWWCLDYAIDGDLRKHNDNRIASAMGVAMDDSKRLVEAMVKARWLDREPYFRVHDWWDYVGRFLQIKWKHNKEAWHRVQELYKERVPELPLEPLLVVQPTNQPTNQPTLAVLPTDKKATVGEPLKGKAKGPLQLRAEKLMHRRPETPLTEEESRAFRRNRQAIESTTEEDWLILEAFYAAPQQETYARKDLATLLNKWNGEIDRAKKWKVNPNENDSRTNPRGADRNTGTANAKRIGQYDGVGKIL